MKSFKFYMPVKIYFGKNCIEENKEIFNGFGEKAMIFTGRSSAKKSGALDDVINALNFCKKEYVVFDEVEENPSVETAVKAAEIGKKENVDFIIGIGGGSPMDTAKVSSFLIANPEKGSEILFESKKYPSMPIIEIPTTAGTGSETTPYSVVTLHEKKTKSGIAQRTFADLTFLDAKYMDKLPDRVTINTAIDALTHLIEGYMCSEASFLSDKIAEAGFEIFAECKDSLISKSFNSETREKLLIASTVAGMVITQAQTSLPHAMGYYLTYFKNIPHGRANAIFMKAYLELFKDNTKVKNLLKKLNFNSLDEMDKYFKDVLDKREEFSNEEVEYYTDELMKVKGKLATFPGELSRNDVNNVFKKSLL